MSQPYTILSEWEYSMMKFSLMSQRCLSLMHIGRGFFEHCDLFLQSAYLHKTKYLIIHHQDRHLSHFIPPLANHCGLGCLTQIFQNFELGHFIHPDKTKITETESPRTVYGNLGILITVVKVKSTRPN